MPLPPCSGTAVMPRRPSAPICVHRCEGNSFELSIPAASGAIFSCANRYTVSRRASMYSPSPKFIALLYIRHLPWFVGSDEPHCHVMIGFRDLFDGQALVGPEPDDHPGHHLDDRHGGQ